MYLYKLPVSKFSAVFGTPDEPIANDVVIIAQKEDCSGFLMLSPSKIDGFEAEQTTPSGYIFTYCQQWGLTINDEVVERVIIDLRVKAYPSIGDQLDILYHNNIMPAELNDKIYNVKSKYSKGIQI